MNRGHSLDQLFAFAAIYIIWGSTYLAIKIAITTIPPFTMTAVRSLLAGTALYVWARIRGARPPTAVEWRWGALVGAFLFLGGHGGLSWAEQRVPSGVASLFIATLPLWMTLLDALTDPPRRLTVQTAAGIVTGMTGIAVLIGPQSLLGSAPVDWMGALVLVLAAVSWAGGSAVAQHGPHADSATLTASTYLLVGGVTLFLAGGVAGEWRSLDPASMSVESLGALAYLIGFGSIVAFGAYSWLLRNVSLAAVSTYAFVNPLVAVWLGWALGGEAVTGRVFLAMLLVITGVGLMLVSDAVPPGRAEARRRTLLLQSGGRRSA